MQHTNNVRRRWTASDADYKKQDSLQHGSRRNRARREGRRLLEVVELRLPLAERRLRQPARDADAHVLVE